MSYVLSCLINLKNLNTFFIGVEVRKNSKARLLVYIQKPSVLEEMASIILKERIFCNRSTYTGITFVFLQVGWKIFSVVSKETMHSKLVNGNYCLILKFNFDHS